MDGMDMLDSPKDKIDMENPVMKAFKGYQETLDDKYNKHERLVKLSRDITIESKRIIFLLHRITDEQSMKHILKDANSKLRLLEKTKLKEMAKELKDDDVHRFIKAISPGLQEYIEAVSFCQYLVDKSLITLQAIQDRLNFDRKDGEEQHYTLAILADEYLLGIADMTGELMRRCIMSVGKQGDINVPFEINTFLSQVYIGMRMVSRSYGVSHQLWRKEHTLKQSLDKVEKACYMITVRGSEIPKHMLIHVFSQPPAASHDFTDNAADI